MLKFIVDIYCINTYTEKDAIKKGEWENEKNGNVSKCGANVDELAIEGTSISYSPNTVNYSYTLDAKNYINNLNTGVYNKAYNKSVFFEGSSKQGYVGNVLTGYGNMYTGLRAEYSIMKELTAKVGTVFAMNTPTNDEKKTPSIKNEISNFGVKTAVEYKADANNLINLQFVFAGANQKITTGSSVIKDTSENSINVDESIAKNTNGYIGLGSYAKTKIAFSTESAFTLEAEGMFTSRSYKAELNDKTLSEVSVTDFGTYIMGTYTIGMFNPYLAVQANMRNVEDKNPGDKDKTISTYTFTSIMPGVDIIIGNLTYRLECDINMDKDDQKQAGTKYESTQIIGYARVKYKF